MHETTADMLYTFLCRGESTDVPFLQRISHITSNYIKAGRSIDEIPVGDFFAPCMSAYCVDAQKMADAVHMKCWANDGKIRYFSLILF